jgi:hypothetical protein
MEMLAGPFTIAAVVLLAAGARKLLDPAPTRGALREMGLPWRGPVVPVLATAEVATGVVALAVGTWWTAAALAAWYAAFAVFVAVALRRETPLSSCGCLGSPDTPPSVAHLGLDVVFAATAVAVAVAPYGALDAVLADQAWWGIPFLLWVGIGVYVSYLLLAVLPLTLEAAHRVRPGRAGPPERISARNIAPGATFRAENAEPDAPAGARTENASLPTSPGADAGEPQTVVSR